MFLDHSEPEAQERQQFLSANRYSDEVLVLSPLFGDAALLAHMGSPTLIWNAKSCSAAESQGYAPLNFSQDRFDDHGGDPSTFLGVDRMEPEFPPYCPILQHVLEKL
jgi:hypothetical protein